MTSDYPTKAQKLAYENFVKEHSPENALRFIISCHKYISSLAYKWRLPGVNRRDKIYDIMAEMYLVLLEDFCECKSDVCNAAFLYLDLKIKRLIQPSRKHIFSDLEEVSPSVFATIDSLTSEKLDMVDEIVNIVRTCVFEYEPENRLVPFLFIHIYPKIHWISELMALKTNIPLEKRYDADAKRIKRFNEKLRNHFDYLKTGDWHEITGWNLMERRHLAYRITSISPKEIYPDAADDLGLLDEWRESFNLAEKQELNNLLIAEKVLVSMDKCFFKTNKSLMAAEEATPWGNPPDLLSMLLGDIVTVNNSVNEADGDFSDYSVDAENDLEFMEVAAELNKWFGNMLSKRNKKSSENRLNW